MHTKSLKKFAISPFLYVPVTEYTAMQCKFSELLLFRVSVLIYCLILFVE